MSPLERPSSRSLFMGLGERRKEVEEPLQGQSKSSFGLLGGPLIFGNGPRDVYLLLTLNARVPYVGRTM